MSLSNEYLHFAEIEVYGSGSVMKSQEKVEDMFVNNNNDCNVVYSLTDVYESDLTTDS